MVLGFLVDNEAFDRLLSLIHAVERANAIGINMSMGLMEQQWFDPTQGLRQVVQHRRDLFNNDFLKGCLGYQL